MKKQILAMLLPALMFTTAHAADIRVEPGFVNLAVVETPLTLGIRIDGVSNFGGFQFDLVFEPDTFSIDAPDDVQLGPFVTDSDRTFVQLGPTIDNDAGKATIGAFSYGDAASPDGGGIIAAISLNLIDSASPGNDLKIDAVQLSDANGDPIAVDSVEGVRLISLTPDLSQVISILQVLSGITPMIDISVVPDIDGDRQVGMGETLYIMGLFH